MFPNVKNLKLLSLSPPWKTRRPLLRRLRQVVASRPVTRYLVRRTKSDQDVGWLYFVVFKAPFVCLSLSFCRNSYLYRGWQMFIGVAIVRPPRNNSRNDCWMLGAGWRQWEGWFPPPPLPFKPNHLCPSLKPAISLIWKLSSGSLG